MKNFDKYQRGYFMPPERCMDWADKEYIDKAPIWCSVDLRDGNQALIIPMSLEEKLEFFRKLVDIGFKEIEIGFPAASETEYEFCRTLIEKNLIPDDVTIQVLTQSREHIIKKTFEAIDGAKNAVVHLYNSTSVAQREQVFRKSKEEIIKIATDGAKLCNEYKKKAKGNITFEYSPESFTGTEPEFARDRYLGADTGEQGHHEPACYRRDVAAPRLCAADRIYVQDSAQQRERHRFPPPAQ